MVERSCAFASSRPHLAASSSVAARRALQCAEAWQGSVGATCVSRNQARATVAAVLPRACACACLRGGLMSRPCVVHAAELATDATDKLLTFYALGGAAAEAPRSHRPTRKKAPRGIRRERAVSLPAAEVKSRVGEPCEGRREGRDGSSSRVGAKGRAGGRAGRWNWRTLPLSTFPLSAMRWSRPAVSIASSGPMLCSAACAARSSSIRRETMLRHMRKQAQGKERRPRPHAHCIVRRLTSPKRQGAGAGPTLVPQSTHSTWTRWPAPAHRRGLEIAWKNPLPSSLRALQTWEPAT